MRWNLILLAAGYSRRFGDRKLLAEIKTALARLLEVTEKATAAEGGKVQALVYHSQVVPAMEALRAPVDQLEMIVDKELWPMPSYGDLIFEV